MAKTEHKKKGGDDALDLMDKRFGKSVDAEALHEKFSEDAEVAEMLFAARQAAGLTQKQLAKLADTTQQVISQLEDADYDGHSMAMLRRIAHALNSRVEIRLVPLGSQVRGFFAQPPKKGIKK